MHPYRYKKNGIQDVSRAHHAGTARWRGSSAINSASIGIEIVHRAADRNYTAAPAVTTFVMWHFPLKLQRLMLWTSFANQPRISEHQKIEIW